MQPISGEGPTLSDALSNAADQLGVDSLEELSWTFVREHFRQGAWSVLIEAGLRTEEELDAIRRAREVADKAAEFLSEALARFGTQAKVSARMRGAGVHVSVLSPDASLLIGREGKNIQAFQLLLTEYIHQNFGERDVRLDVDSPDREKRSRDRDGDRDGGRGRRRDRDGERGRGRGRRGDDRRDRGGRKSDPERDDAIRAEAREAAQRVLDGDEDSVVLSEMNSYERHVAHSTIKDIDGVRSQSVGEGRDKLVEVILS